MTSPNSPSQEEAAPVSISSLRSKFESLAAANSVQNGKKPPVALKPEGSKVAGISRSRVNSVSSSTVKAEYIVNSSWQSQPPGRPVTPKPPILPKPTITSPSPPQPASILDRRPSEPPQSISLSATPSQPVASPSLPIPSTAPIIVSTPAPPAESSFIDGRERSVSDIGYSSPRFNGSRPASPRPLRRPAPDIPRAASPQSVDVEPAPSVKALRERFAGGANIAKAASIDVLPSSSEMLSGQDSSLGVAQLSSSPGQLDGLPHRPISRTGSPVPPDRSTKPSVRSSPQPTPSGSGSQTPTESSVPPLPVRKPSAQLDPRPNSLGHQPTQQSPARSPSLTDIGPPRLPQRSRAQTVTQSEDTRPSAPPRLPTRQATITRPVHAHSVSLPIPQDPVDYQPPPPPIRNLVSPPRQSSREEPGDVSSEDEEEEGPAPLSNLSSTAKRALEDHPDTTHANRRPPKFVPEVRMVQPHHIYAFAAFGRHVVTGAHHVRVYDTQMSEKPMFIVELRDTGLDFRIKDPKVTAMAFRPGSHPADEGRYLWCGTKDGHLWELDIMTGQVSDTKAGVHGAAVVNIFRYKQQILTLDEMGKLLVYDVPKSDVAESHISPHLTRTIRIPERFTFARMIQDKLWTSTAPAARSTTTIASKGATIRVYEPCASGASPPARTLFTTEWTGAVTSATVLPLDNQTVYLGHEGGFVSIWSVAELVCIQVIKVSASDILSLEGVGEKLWAGNRKGQIHVYDVSQKPWLGTNVWTAHSYAECLTIAHPSDHPITLLYADPWAIEHTGRYTVWSFTRESITAWDGLLSVDWIDCQMTLRQPDYCTYREVKVLVCSWNIDSAKPSDLSGSEANTTALEQILTSVDRPDIIVFGFQEVIPLTNKKLTAKTLLFGGKSKDAGATADKISSAYRLWLDKLTAAVRMATPSDCTYVKVQSESLVGLFTCVFVRTEERDALRAVDICTVKRGLGNIYGNKGAIVARMILDDTSICFINVHLAAGQSQKAARNADIGGIMEDKAILPESHQMPFVHGGDGTAILDHELVILNGDLNYRIDQRRENVLSNISTGDFSHLLEHDQLRKEMRGNHAFRLRSFDEAPITFAPTYKYNRGSTEYDSSEKKRIPAWCDRILYTRSPYIEPINYQRYEATISDHRPISVGFRLKVKSVDKVLRVKVRGEVGEAYVKREIEMLEKMVKAMKELV